MLLMMVFILLILRIADPIAIAVAILSALAFSIGVVGLAINIVFGLKSGDRADILFGLWTLSWLGLALYFTHCHS